MNPATSTYQDLIVRVAEALGFASNRDPDNAANNVARMPTDPNRLDICKRAIVDGMRMIVRDGPRPHGWRCLRETITLDVDAEGEGSVNIAGDPSRLRLPPGCESGPVNGSLQFKLASSTVAWSAIQTTEGAIIRSLGNNDSTDYPRAFAVLPYQGGSADDRAGWELRIFPRPSQDMTISGTFRKTVPANIMRTSDTHPFGAINDDLVFIAAMYARMRVDGKAAPGERAYWKNEYHGEDGRGGAIAQAIAADASNAPRSHGVGTDPSVDDQPESSLMYPSVQVQLDGTALD